MHIVQSASPNSTTEVRGRTFTGTVLGTQSLPGDLGVAVTDVVFLPGARTHWHSHEGGQVLRVTAGSGWVCTEGQEPQQIGVGDTVWTAAGERHWHGASETHLMAHMAVSLGTTTWLQPVKTREYPTDPTVAPR